ncbi:MAG: T9SS type A sorting domain-containing protein [Bacteroidales bacterium]|nr:T9SS type A sorting domain-containing protein [Bacteroidales bacterium]
MENSFAQAYLIIFFYLLFTPLNAQIKNSGSLKGLILDNNRTVPYIFFNVKSKSEFSEFQNFDGFDKNLKVDYSGYREDVNITPEKSGRWDTLSNGMKIWRIGIAAPGTRSISVLLNEVNLQSGVKVVVSSLNSVDITDAITLRYVKSDELYACRPVKGDSIIVEMQLSHGIPVEDYFKINSVYIGFKDESPEKTFNDEWFGQSGPCEVDVNCISDAYIQSNKHSSCRIVTYGYNYIKRCSGSLINNTRENGRALVLTAGHCIEDQSEALGSIFFFDYESPYCGGPDGEIKSVTGSRFLSRTDYLDFTLVELMEKPSVNFYPLYAGWDATGNEVLSSYIIHHPEGDVKKIALDEDFALTGSYGGFNDNTHWLITDYEMGSTGAGSSGSAMLDSNNRIVGTLTGGGAECTNPIYDYYQKFSHSWADYSAYENQLMHWLDPLESGVLVFDSFDPYEGIITGYSNFNLNDTIPSLLTNGEWGYISGHSSDGYKEFSEFFSNDGTKYIYGISMEIDRAFDLFPLSSVIVKIWDNVDDPEVCTFQREFYLYEFEPEMKNNIWLDTLIQVNRDFRVGYEISYDIPCDTFALRTFIPKQTNTAFKRLGNRWIPVDLNVEYRDISLGIIVLLLDYYPPPGSGPVPYPFEDIHLYPNPVEDHFQILFKEVPAETVQIKLYNTYGRLIDTVILDPPQKNNKILLKRLVRGTYIVKIETSQYSVVKKFIKL